MTIVEMLEGSHIFEGLAESQLESLADIAKEEVYRAGQTIFREGEESKKLYILEEGKIILEMRIDLGQGRRSAPATIDAVVPGESFGWSALVEPYVFTLTAQCVDKCRLIALDGARLREMMKDDPALGYHVLQRLAKLIASRLMHTRQTLISERGLALMREA